MERYILSYWTTLVDKIIYRWWRMSETLGWGTRRLILPEQNYSNGKENSPNFTLFSTNPLWTGLGSNAGCSNEMPAINRQSFFYIYILTAIGLSPGGSSTVHIYNKIIHRMTQNKQYIDNTTIWESVGSAPSWLVWLKTSQCVKVQY